MNRRQFNKNAVRVIGAWLPLAFPFAVLVSACTNSFLKNPGNVDPSALRAPIANSGRVDSSLVITRVTKSAVDPGSSFDLVGDGSGAMAQFCFSENGSSVGESNCRCDYSYILPDGSENGFDVPTTYHDANLIRCPFVSTQSIPSSVSLVNVRVFLTNEQNYTNTIQVKMSGTGTALDLSDPLSFIQAQRYQCRDVAIVPYAFPDTGGLLDPVLGDSPKVTYPLNYYTTNMGGTLTRFAALSPDRTSSWSCPHIPNDSSEGSGLDLTVYSLGPDETGSKQIFPPKAGFDRSTFYLARSSTGIFNVPVNALIAPTLATGSEDVPPLGYGASPIPTKDGETCPDTDPSVTIPDGYEWVKVWLFRANLAPREYRVSTAILTVNSIGCNPGKWPVASTEDVFPDCKNLLTMKQAGDSGNPAGRVLMIPRMCVNLTGSFAPCSGNGPGCTTKTSTEMWPDTAQFALGTDVWKPSPNSTSYSCGQPNNVDPLNICRGDTIPVPHVDSDQLIVQNMDLRGERFDFLFVVTPPTMTTLTMKNLASSTSHAYIPYRFRPGDCASPDPENPLVPGDCDGSKRITYGLKLHDVISNGDPPANNQNRAGVFPVCTIRPKGG